MRPSTFSTARAPGSVSIRSIGARPPRARFGRLSQRKENDLVPGAIPGLSGGAANGHVRIVNQQLTIGVTQVPTTSQLVEVRLGISRTKAGKTPTLAAHPELEYSKAVSVGGVLPAGSDWRVLAETA